MNDNLRSQIRVTLDQKSTDELLEIWRNNNQKEWTELAFDVVREILQDRRIELPQQHSAGIRLRPEIDEITDVGELEQRISDCETRLEQAKGKRVGRWVSLIVSFAVMGPIFAKIVYGGPYIILSGAILFYLGLNIWKIYSTGKRAKEIETELEECREKMTELQSARHNQVRMSDD